MANPKVQIDKLVLPKLRGFCAGVVRAIDVVEKVLEVQGPPVYVRKEIVHNKFVVDTLKSKGAVFVDELDEVPDNNVVIFAAHGVAPEVWNDAMARKLRIIDATCPLVTKVHVEALQFAKKGFTILLIGHGDHDETIGTLGEAPDSIRLVESVGDAKTVEVIDPQKVAYLTQTTLSLDDTKEIVETLKQRFPKLTQPPKEDICYATTNRQNAVKALAKQVDLLLVIGAHNSSNSLRLVEVARAAGRKSYLIERASDIQSAWLYGRKAVGITSSASAPESLVKEVVDYFRSKYGVAAVEEIETVQEDVLFSLPQEIEQLKVPVA
jgi:4-hydroxy-3-methylbut-2-en-1-yl diphosphate reductase